MNERRRCDSYQYDTDMFERESNFLKMNENRLNGTNNDDK